MDEIAKRIIAFKNSDTTKKLRDFYLTTSLMEIYGINRKEIKHTSFFKWLFSPNCDISKIALKQMLDIIVTSNHFNSDLLNDELYKLIVIGNYDIESWNSEENFSIAKGKIDLFITLKINIFNLHIVIENKICSPENEQQTQRYYDFITNKYKDSSNLFVYLTPISTIELENLEIAECCCENYVQLNYQVLVDKIIEPLLDKVSDKTTAYIIEDYLKALSHPVNSNQKNYKFMAISNRESELLTKFWTENEDLILKAIEATKGNAHIEPAQRVKAEKIGELLKDDGEKVGAYVKRMLIKLFKDDIIPEKEVKQFQDKSYSKKTFGINHPLLIKMVDRDEKPIHYWKDTVSVRGEEFFMCCEWFEKEGNNNRVLFENWLKAYK